MRDTSVRAAQKHNTDKHGDLLAHIDARPCTPRLGIKCYMKLLGEGQKIVEEKSRPCTANSPVALSHYMRGAKPKE